MKTLTYGKFIETFPKGHDSLELTFTPLSHSIRQRWSNNRLSAHFLADYVSNFLPINDDMPHQDIRVRESKGAISYIANELLENAMKFHENTAVHSKIHIGVHVIDILEDPLNAIVFAINTTHVDNLHRFQVYIHKLLTTDPDELYLQQVESSAADETGNSSGLGLLTMITDYDASLGWKFEPNPDHPQTLTVTTMARIYL